MSRKRVQGRLYKLSPEHKAKRMATRNRKKTWAVRVWAKRHIKAES